MPQDPFRNYEALLERVDAHVQRIASAYPLRCARGCSACCHVRLSVSRVEADHIRAARPSAPTHTGRGALDGHPLFDRLAGPEPCVFLGPEGECAIYAVRPLICRSHGVPIRIEARVDACPLNGDPQGGSPREGGPGGGRLLDAPALSLELVNTTLAAIDDLYCRETGQSPGRVALEALAKEGGGE